MGIRGMNNEWIVNIYTGNSISRNGNIMCDAQCVYCVQDMVRGRRPLHVPTHKKKVWRNNNE